MRSTINHPLKAAALAVSLVLLACGLLIDTSSIRMRRPLRFHFDLSNSTTQPGDAKGSNTVNMSVPAAQEEGVPAVLAEWSTQSDFLLNCTDLAPGGIPADHPSNLGPLFMHPADQPIAYGIIYQELESAIASTEAIKKGAIQAPPLSCLVSPQPATEIPKPKIGIVVIFYSPDDASKGQDSMYTRSLRDKQEYAFKHGYELITVGKLAVHAGRPSYYAKWSGCMAHLRRFDWLWLLDLDTIIMNHTIPLTTFLDPNYDIVMTRDCNGLNAGTMIFRNSTWSFMYIAEVYMHNGDGLRNGTGNWPLWWGMFPDNAMVWKLGEQEKILQRIKVLPQRAINAYAPGADCPGGYYKDGDFMLHFAGLAKPMFDSWWAKRNQTAHKLGDGNVKKPWRT